MDLLKDYAREQLKTEPLTDVKGYPIVTSCGRAHLGTGHVLLTGDAAGLAEPLLGEGIYSALKSGILSAQAIEHAVGPKASAPLDALGWYKHALED